MPESLADASVFHRHLKPFVVGLGASAGGIAALNAFFRNVPPESGAAYVVILHLSPDHDSQLAQVLSVTATIPVTQVIEQTRIEANHVYVVSPNKTLTIDDGSIVVNDIMRPEERRAPVDMFFRSLADAQGARAVCVILSGTGPNGSAGLKRVKEYGGLAIAQDPQDAEYTDMPRNAIATGLVDLVLPATEIPAKIAAYHEQLSSDFEVLSTSHESDTEPLRDILTVLRIRTGHDFSNYKTGTLQRRIERRVHLRHLESIHEYARAVKQNPGEAVALMKDLLISVTNFFRDPDVFHVLANRVVPELFAHKGPTDQIRVWVPACATGEEAYSIAMLLLEAHAGGLDEPLIQIFATDLDEQAIAIARDGFYSQADVADLSEQRLHRFFVREVGGYRVRRDVRELVLFAHHNVIKDPPFSHLNLISCRNLLIYLNRTVQERVLETFHFALRSGGYLLLGAAESPDTGQDLFAPVDKAARIYESRTVTSRLVLPALDPAITQPRMPLTRIPDARNTDRVSPGELHLRLLERYAPPSLVVTEEHNVVHMSETVGRFLQIAAGEPTRDLLRILRPELRPETRSALLQAIRERRTVDVAGISVLLQDGEHRVDISVKPVLRDGDHPTGYLLVVFTERENQQEQTAAHRLASAAEPIAAQLEDELGRAKQQLRATVEQYETQAEEATAANEELQAMNEELRSAAEELETSKEELQSVNEELTTVNQELKIKIDELGTTNNDYQNLINATDIGTIFLDRQLRVKMSTPAAEQLFNLRRSDAGRPLSDITTDLLYQDIYRDVERVLLDLRTIEREVQTRDGRWISARLRPYRTTDDRIDGIVITLQDISSNRRAEAQLRQNEERLRLLIEGATEYAIVTMSGEGIIDSWNPGAERMFGYRAAEIVGRHAEVLFTAEDRAADVPRLELREAYETGRAADDRFHVRRDGSRFFCSGTTLRLGESLGFAKIARDLSTQQQATEALRVVRAEFDEQVRLRTDELHAEVQARTDAYQHVTGLLQKLVTAQEDERARISRDLHDQLGQQLTGLRLSLQRIAEDQRSDEVLKALKLTEEIDRELDFLSWELRPAVLDDLGLAAALPLFVQEWAGHYQITAEYKVGRYASDTLGRDAEIVFYRVAQEALNNVVKHAHASRVDVLLDTRENSVVLVVEDDGVGFDPHDRSVRETGIGIAGMQERAGLIGAAFEVESRVGDGTSIYLRVAVKPGVSQDAT